MSIAHRVRFVWLADYVAVAAGALLTQKLGAFTERWRFTAWMFVWLAIIADASHLVRCPHCRARVPREVGKFAYIRCQACRRRFDGREGPDPEVSDELLAGGDPILLEAYREESAEMNRLSRAKTGSTRGPAARPRGRGAAVRSRPPGEGGRHMAEFLRRRLQRIRQEIVELRRRQPRAS